MSGWLKDGKQYGAMVCFLLCLSIPLLLVACGGSGGGHAHSSLTNTIVRGAAVKGPVQIGTVRVYQITNNGSTYEEIATTDTDANGRFELDLDNFEGPILVRVDAGTMPDEIGFDGSIVIEDHIDEGANFTFDDLALGAVARVDKGVNNVQVTLLTQLAWRLYLALIELNVETNDAIDFANDAFSDFFGFNIRTVRPTNITSLPGGTELDIGQANVRYALIQAGLWLECAQAAAAYDAHPDIDNDPGTTKGFDAFKWMGRDCLDGIFDEADAIGFAPISGAGLGEVWVNTDESDPLAHHFWSEFVAADSFRAGLRQAMIDFLDSASNQTGIESGDGDFLAWANALAAQSATFYNH